MKQVFVAIGEGVALAALLGVIYFCLMVFA
jgi:hypothetical protein